MADARTASPPHDALARARAEIQRLELRVAELGAALQGKHESFLEMLDRLQEREEEAVQRALRELRKLRHQNELILESAAEGIVGIDNAGRITFANPAAARMLDLSVDAMQKQPFAALIGLPDFDFHTAQPPGAGAAGVQDATVRAREFRRRDGSLFSAEYVTTPLREEGEQIGAVVVFRDVTERLEQQRSLEQTAAELEQALIELQARTEEAEAAQRRTSLLAEAGRVLAASLDYVLTVESAARLVIPELAAWCIILVHDKRDSWYRIEVRAEDDLKRTPEPGHAPVQTHAPSHALARVIETGQPELHPQVHDALLRDIAGDADQLDALQRERFRSAMIVPLVSRDQVLGVMTFLRREQDPPYQDADLMLASELARRAAAAADNARLYEEALIASRAKSDFLAVMSHELRTPLNAIIGYADLIQAEIAGPISDQQQQHVGRVKVSAQHLLQLIEEILSFSRIEAGGEQLRLESFELQPLLRDTAAMVEPLMRDKGLTFTVSLPEQPLQMRTDAGKLRQILLNLLSNAVKFTDHGEVRLKARVEDGWLHLAVEDTGVGIAREDQARIFDPFWQVEQSTTRKSGGTGLGLSVTHSLARLLGGAVSVESEPGRGSSFRVLLPLDKVAGS